LHLEQPILGRRISSGITLDQVLVAVSTTYRKLLQQGSLLTATSAIKVDGFKRFYESARKTGISVKMIQREVHRDKFEITRWSRAAEN